MAISIVGSASSSAATVAIPAHQAGDLIVIFAYNPAANTVPTVGSGFTAIAAGSGGNTNASVVGYCVATGSGTTSGTWTNATRMSVIVLRSSSGTLAIGANASASGNATTSVSYPALTLQNTSGSSWVIGCAGHRTATNVEVAPTGMTNSTSSASSSGECAIHTTGAGVSSWSAASVTVNASSAFRSWTVEVKELPSVSGALSATETGADTASISGTVSTGSSGSSVWYEASDYAEQAIVADFANWRFALPLLGSQLVPNGDFTTDLSGWNLEGPSNSSVVDGKLVLTGDGVADYPQVFRYDVPVTAGKLYRLSARAKRGTTPHGLTISCGSALTFSTTNWETKEIYFVAGSTGNIMAGANITAADATGTAYVDYIRVQEVQLDKVSGAVPKREATFDEVFNFQAARSTDVATFVAQDGSVKDTLSTSNLIRASEDFRDPATEGVAIGFNGSGVWNADGSITIDSFGRLYKRTWNFSPVPAGTNLVGRCKVKGSGSCIAYLQSGSSYSDWDGPKVLSLTEWTEFVVVLPSAPGSDALLALEVNSGPFTLTEFAEWQINIGTVLLPYEKTAEFMYGAAMPRRDYRNGHSQLLLEGQRTQLLNRTATLPTQTISVSGGNHALSFTGTGSITLSGAGTGTLNGTGANNRVSTQVTLTTGSLTLTVSGDVRMAQLEAGPFPTAYIPNAASSGTVTRATESCRLSLLAEAIFTRSSGASLLGRLDPINDSDNRYLVSGQPGFDPIVMQSSVDRWVATYASSVQLTNEQIGKSNDDPMGIAIAINPSGRTLAWNAVIATDTSVLTGFTEVYLGWTPSDNIYGYASWDLFALAPERLSDARLTVLAVPYSPPSNDNVSGTLTATETGSDTAAISGQVGVTGTLARTETGSDTAAISGLVVIAGTLSAQELGVDTATASGQIGVTGTLAGTETGTDTSAISGSITAPGVAGTLAATEIGSDTAAISGLVVVAGSLSAAEIGSDTAAIAGTVTAPGVSGTLAATEVASDTLAATGQVGVTGTLARTETGTDTLAASGQIGVTGTLARTETGTDTAAITGQVTAPGISGSMNATETGTDTLAPMTGVVLVAGTLAGFEVGNDVSSIIGSVRVQGALTANENGVDTAAVSGSIGVLGALASVEVGTDTFVATGSVSLPSENDPDVQRIRLHGRVEGRVLLQAEVADPIVLLARVA